MAIQEIAESLHCEKHIVNHIRAVVFAPDEGLEAMLRLEISSDVEITAFLSWEFSSSAKVPHLKLFICGVTGHPRGSANICHAPGLAQARPHDAMHLPSLEVI